MIKDKRKQILTKFKLYDISCEDNCLIISGTKDKIDKFKSNKKSESGLKSIIKKFKFDETETAKIEVDSIEDLRILMKWPGILYATDIRSRVKSIRFTHKDPDNSDSLCDYNKLQKEHIWGAINTFLFRKYHLLSQKGDSMLDFNKMDFLESLLSKKIKEYTSKAADIDTTNKYCWIKKDSKNKPKKLEKEINYQLERKFLMKTYPITKLTEVENSEGADHEKIENEKQVIFKSWKDCIKFNVCMVIGDDVQSEDAKIVDLLVTFKSKDLKKYIENKNQGEFIAKVKDKKKDKEFKVYRYEDYEEEKRLQDDPYENERVKISIEEIQEDDDFEDKTDTENYENSCEKYSFGQHRKIISDNYFNL